MGSKIRSLTLVAMLALPVTLHSAPLLTARETSRDGVGIRVSVEASLSIAGMAGLRGVEVRLREPAAPGNEATLTPTRDDGEGVFYQTKRVTRKDGRRDQVMAVVFPARAEEVAEDAVKSLGTLRYSIGSEAQGPEITAEAVMRDKSRIPLQVAYEPLGAGAAGASKTSLVLAPNPSKAEVEIRYRLAVRSAVEVVVYDLKGRRVRSVHRGPEAPGQRSVLWDGRNDEGEPVALGVYFVRVRMGDRVESGHVTLMR